MWRSPPACAARAGGVLRDRALGGELEPRALRRRALRAARRRTQAIFWTCTRGRATTASARRSSDRIMLGTYALSAGYYDAYYGRAQRVRTKIAQDFRQAFAEVDLIVTPTSRERRLRAGREDGRPLVDVPQRLLHRADVACRDPGDLAAVRSQHGGRRRRAQGTGLPVGFQIAGPAFSENRLLDAALCAGGGDRL